MLRLAALGLAAALVLSIGPTEDRRSEKERYVAGVAAALDEQRVVRLLDEVLNFARVGCRLPHLFCDQDTNTRVGGDWIRSEHRLQVEMRVVLRRLAQVKPPSEIATEHRVFVLALSRCLEDIPGLESQLPPPDNLAAVYAFEEAVGDRVDCFPRLFEIAGKFEDKGYPFLPGPLGGVVEAYGYYGFGG
jgi:hypothetical protein